MLVLHMGISKR